MFDPVAMELELAEFEGRLRIDRHSLDEELVEQPHLFNQVARQAARWGAARDEAKDKIKVVEGQLNGRLREEAATKGDRVTDTAVKALVDSHPERAEAVRAHITATRLADEWAALKESFASRGFMIRDLCQLWSQGYFQRSSVTVPTGPRVTPALDQANRAQLAAGRSAAMNTPPAPPLPRPVTEDATPARVRVNLPPEPI